MVKRRLSPPILARLGNQTWAFSDTPATPKGRDISQRVPLRRRRVRRRRV